MNDTALINDPIHGCIPFTYPIGDSDVAEKDIIDDVWMQRLRQIYQLQSTRWVFPSAEHTRFQHSIGTMHLASRFINRLYGGLKSVDPDCPDKHYVEELARLAGLLHDVGHGPFGHFCDQYYLEEYGYNHEILGQHIIRSKLGDKLSQIKRSPYGKFSGLINPDDICFLIKKPEKNPEEEKKPLWIKLLRNLFSNIVTVDNLDYVMRDSFYSGVGVARPNVNRMLFYMNFKDGKFVIHKKALQDIVLFVESKQSLYKTLYYHRTARIIDIQIKSVFKETLSRIMGGTEPKETVVFLNKYLKLTDWSLLCAASNNEIGGAVQLHNAWKDIINRTLHWQLIWDSDFEEDDAVSFPDNEQDIYDKINRYLPKDKHISYKVDMASQDPRPEIYGDVIKDASKKIYVEDHDGTISEKPLVQALSRKSSRTNHVRVFINKENIGLKHLLMNAIEKAKVGKRQSLSTNV